MSQVPSHINALGLTLLPAIQAKEAEVAPVAEKKLKVQRKSKKMMTEQIPVIPKKIEMDFQSSAEGSVSQQASQMSQPTTVVVKKTIKVPRKNTKVQEVQEKKEEVPVVVVQEVAELLAEMVERAYQEELKEKTKAVRLAKAKATREANKLKKKQEEEERLAREAEEDAERTETEDEGEDEEGEGKEEGEYEVSTKKRPIQKSKEGRVLEGRFEAVEGDVKKELKVLKTKLGDVIGKLKDEEKIEAKREELEMKKKQAITKVHHTIAEKFNTSVVVARRSEAGRGEKKTAKSKPVHLKQETIQKLFWANCERVLPHFVKDFISFSKAKQEYAKIIKNACVFGADETISKEVKKNAREQLSILFANASQELVDETNALFLHNTSEETDRFHFPEIKRSILATTLSSQGVYVVKRHDHKRSNETLLVLRNSRDELIEPGNPNEVMSEKDLVFHNEHALAFLGTATLKKICEVVLVAHEPSEEEVAPPVKKAKKVKFVAVKEEEEFLVEYCE